MATPSNGGMVAQVIPALAIADAGSGTEDAFEWSSDIFKPYAVPCELEPISEQASSADVAPPQPTSPVLALTPGRKIPACYENPVDNWMIMATEQFNPVFHALGMVPNHVTLLSAVFGITSVILLTQSRFGLAGATYMISYFFDVADGNYARAYQMVSKFGDILDHAKDVLVVAMLYWVILFQLSLSTTFKVIFFIAQGLMITGLSIHLGCQEVYYNGTVKQKKEEESAALKGLQAVCAADAEKKLPLTRWIGCGTYALITALWMAAMQWYV